MPTSENSDLSASSQQLKELRNIYEAEVAPVLREREGEREAGAKFAQRMNVAAGIVGLAVAGGGFLIFNNMFAVFAGLIVGFGIYSWGRTKIGKLAREAKLMMVQPLAAALDFSYAETPGAQAEAELQNLLGLSLVPTWNRKTLQDGLSGRHRGIDVSFFEAKLEQKRTSTDSKGRTKTRWVTVFQGQCWTFDAPKVFYGKTIVSRDAGMFNALAGFGSSLDRARLEDPVFEKAFEVRTTDQVEARFLLTPDVMQTLVDLEESFAGKKLRVAFCDGKITAAAEAGNLFEAGSMFKRLDDESRVQRLLQDFAAVFQVVDVLHVKDKPRDESDAEPDGTDSTGLSTGVPPFTD